MCAGERRRRINSTIVIIVKSSFPAYDVGTCKEIQNIDNSCSLA